MGVVGTLFLGAVTGLLYLWIPGPWRAPQAVGALPPASASLRARRLLAVLICAVAALLIKMLGNITGLLTDGSVLEWCFSLAAALLAAWLCRLFLMSDRERT